MLQIPLFAQQAPEASFWSPLRPSERVSLDLSTALTRCYYNSEGYIYHAKRVLYGKQQKLYSISRTQVCEHQISDIFCNT